MSIYGFDAASAGRIAKAVRWVEDYIEEEGSIQYGDTHEGDETYEGDYIDGGDPGDPNDPAPPLPPEEPGDPTDPNPGDPTEPPVDPPPGGYTSKFAAFVSFGTWNAGSANRFVIGSGESAKSVYAMNPFADATGPGVIVNCGSVWVLVAANCKTDDGDSSSGAGY